MEILYISDSVSLKKKEYLNTLQKKPFIQPQQKFHYQIVKGLVSLPEVNVVCLSSYCISSSTSDVKCIPEDTERVQDNLEYRYIKQKNGRFSHYTSILNNTPKFIKKWIKETDGKERVIIVDVLNYLMIARSFGFLKKKGIKVLGFVTDLPDQTTTGHSKKVGLLHYLLGKLLEHCKIKSIGFYDAFIPVAETINHKINKWDRPYLVVEGSVDENLRYTPPSAENNKVVLYAGGVYEKYGVKTLVEAFGELNTDAELHIYGNGTCVPYIENYSKDHPNIFYKGMVDVGQIYELEKKASILVNPRPSNEEFAVCSFPSKIHEYMSTGRPMIITRLRGIPDEYFKYCFVFEKESKEGIKQTLDVVLRKSNEELEEVGKRAFDFVIDKKSNVMQAKKIRNFINKLL